MAATSSGKGQERELSFAVEYGATRKRVHGFEWIPDQIPRFRELWVSN